MGAMTVKDLIDALSKYPGDSKVMSTWEGIFRDIEVYASADGIVIVDCDACFYRDRIEKAVLGDNETGVGLLP